MSYDDDDDEDFDGESTIITRVSGSMINETLSQSLETTGTRILGENSKAFCIKWEDDKGRARHFQIATRLHIGRKTGDVIIKEKTVSSNHCTIYNHNGVISIVDEGSANGTYVEGRRIKAGRTVLLNVGDTVLIGKVPLQVVTLKPDDPILEKEAKIQSIEIEEDYASDESLSKVMKKKMGKWFSESKEDAKGAEVPIEELVEKSTPEKTNAPPPLTKTQMRVPRNFNQNDAPPGVPGELTKSRQIRLNKEKKKAISFADYRPGADSFLRIIAFAIDMFIALTIYRELRSSLIWPLFSDNASQLIDTLQLSLLAAPLKVVWEGILPSNMSDWFTQHYFVFIIYFVLRFLASIFFGVSFGQFLTYLRGSGSALENRMKAIIRLPIEILTAPWIIFDLPCVVGKKTFKELVTKSFISSKKLGVSAAAGVISLIFFGGVFGTAKFFIETSKDARIGQPIQNIAYPDSDLPKRSDFFISNKEGAYSKDFRLAFPAFVSEVFFFYPSARIINDNNKERVEIALGYYDQFDKVKGRFINVKPVAFNTLRERIRKTSLYAPAILFKDDHESVSTLMEESLQIDKNELTNHILRKSLLVDPWVAFKKRLLSIIPLENFEHSIISRNEKESKIFVFSEFKQSNAKEQIEYLLPSAINISTLYRHEMTAYSTSRRSSVFKHILEYSKQNGRKFRPNSEYQQFWSIWQKVNLPLQDEEKSLFQKQIFELFFTLAKKAILIKENTYIEVLEQEIDAMILASKKIKNLDNEDFRLSMMKLLDYLGKRDIKFFDLPNEQAK